MATPDFLPRRFVLGTMTALALQGCMTLPSPIVVANPDSAGATHFDGLQKLLQRDGALRILVVHGMSPHEVGYSANLQAELRDHLGLSLDEPCAIIDTLTLANGASSFVQRCAYTRGEQTVRVYELTWSEFSQRLIEVQLGYDWKNYGAQRVWLDGQLKEKLIDKAFGDAIIYSGPFAPTMQRAVARGICVLMTDEPTRQIAPGFGAGCTFDKIAEFGKRGAKPPIALIGHSLGSFMVFETIGKLQNDTADRSAQVSAANFLDRLRLVAFLANQLPLLALSRQRADTSGRLAPMVKLLDGGGRSFPIVAVSDPNDLLSYPLDPGWPEKLGIPGSRVINVSLANTNAVLAAVVNPGKAHTGYFDNKCVIRLLIDATSQMLAGLDLRSTL